MDMGNQAYSDAYLNVDFRQHPEKYRIGRGEQGVLMAEPYKSEILPHWRFRTPAIAQESAEKIYGLFLQYLEQKDFVGADMARKFLQMGWTRSRRYANHASGRKYAAGREVRQQAADAMTSDKAKSAEIFKHYYDKARANEVYSRLKTMHLAK